MNRLFFDLETTSLDCYSAEIIEGYFVLKDENNKKISEHYLKSQVDNYNAEAYGVHGISEALMRTYLPKKAALDNLSEFLSSCGLFEAIVYANPNQMGSIYHYDVAVLQMQLMNHLHVDKLEHQPFKPQKITSVYTMAKEAIKEGLIDPVKKDNNRADLSLSGVYKALFGNSFNAHNAKEDVEAMLKVYKEIIDRRNNGAIVRDQLELI